MVFLTEILRGEDPRARYAAKQTQIIDKDQLIDDGNAGHGFRADPADHDIVQKVYEISDAVLHHDGHGNRQNHLIESSVAYEFV